MAVAASPLSGARSPNSKALTPNVANVILGNLHIKPWYPSAYPDDLVGKKVERLYVCQWCFRYTVEIVKFAEHCKVCPLKSEPPPGALIYAKDAYEIREVDGEEHKLYAQNLSLFAKLFLETKSVFFDASTFLYYTLLLRDPTGSSAPSNNPGRVTAFFSKEKMSWDNNNLACILVFPPYQHRGLGQVLIAASYELGRREGRFGGPEKPLSSLGRRGYLLYWTREIARALLTSPRLPRQLPVAELSRATWITPEDVVAALREMEGVGDRKTPGGSVVVNKAVLRSWVEKKGWDLERPIVDPDAFTVEQTREDEGSDMAD